MVKLSFGLSIVIVISYKFAILTINCICKKIYRYILEVSSSAIKDCRAFLSFIVNIFARYLSVLLLLYFN